MSALQITSHGIVLVDGLQIQSEGLFNGSDASKHPEILRRVSEENNRAVIPLPKAGQNHRAGILLPEAGDTSVSHIKRNQYIHATTLAEQQPVQDPTMAPAQQADGSNDVDLALALPNRRPLLKDQGEDNIKTVTACANF